MPSKKPRLTVYLTEEELRGIEASAARAGISLSTFAKLVCTGLPVPTLEHKQAVQEIIKARRPWQVGRPAQTGHCGGRRQIHLAAPLAGGGRRNA